MSAINTDLKGSFSKMSNNSDIIVSFTHYNGNYNQNTYNEDYASLDDGDNNNFTFVKTCLPKHKKQNVKLHFNKKYVKNHLKKSKFQKVQLNKLFKKNKKHAKILQRANKIINEKNILKNRFIKQLNRTDEVQMLQQHTNTSSNQQDNDSDDDNYDDDYDGNSDWDNHDDDYDSYIPMCNVCDGYFGCSCYHDYDDYNDRYDEEELCNCRIPGCYGDCGVLPCGCIDVCRSYCEERYLEYGSDNEW